MNHDAELKEKALSILANMTLYWDAVQIAYKIVYTRRDIVSVSPEQKQTLDEAVTSLSNGLAAFIHDREAKAEKRGFQKCLMEFDSTEGMREAERRGRLEELESLDHNKQMHGDWQQVVEDRIAELTAQSEGSEE